MDVLIPIFTYLLPFLVLVGFELNGFRKAHDRWPTISQLMKHWVGGVPKGIATWGWKRWFVAAVLPALAIILEFHWVFQLF